MKKIAVIGAGVSGLTAAQELSQRYCVRVFEREMMPGGLIRCQRVEGNLFHLCGGHVFNTKRLDVLKWFWRRFDQQSDFILADRNSAVGFGDGRIVPYPIENHLYCLEEPIQRSIVQDLLAMATGTTEQVDNFKAFLLSRFGKTLYDLYFGPYNAKVWRRDLSKVPLSWLEGKLPMPTIAEILLANMNHVEEKQFVHSTFWYAKENGSQFIAGELANGIDVTYGVACDEIEVVEDGCRVCGELFDRIVYSGNLQEIPKIVKGVDFGDAMLTEIAGLESHGTTSVLCEIDPNPYSWLYQPSPCHRSHRIICTGNFSPANNRSERLSATVEFTDEITRDEIMEQLPLMPFHPCYMAHNYNRVTYPIQHANTRSLVQDVRSLLARHNIYLVGRFAEWEYYNMDAAMASALDLVKKI